MVVFCSSGGGVSAAMDRSVLLALLLLLVLLSAGAGAEQFKRNKSRFVLVHGAGHGAWCWYKVSSLLQRAGYTVDAIDLRSAGISSVDPAAVRTLEQYSQPLIQLLNSTTEQVVLVAHSFGGAAVTLGMEQFTNKVKAAVFVSALMYRDGPNDVALSQQEFNSSSVQNNIDYQFVNGTPVTGSFKLNTVAEVLYNLSPHEDIVLAKSLLKPSPLVQFITRVTENGYGSIPRYFVLTTKDKIVLPESQVRIIQNNPPRKVFKVDSDHSPFFSKPGKLVDILQEVVEGQGLN